MRLRVPPLLQMFVCALLGWIVTTVFADYIYTNVATRLLGWTVLAAGLFMLALSVAAFARTKTTVNPKNPEHTSSLVTTGIYRLSRNPMYVGMAAVLIGYSLLLQNLFAFISPAVFVLAVTWLQILPEEEVLEQKFGDAFGEYRRQTPRWI